MDPIMPPIRERRRLWDLLGEKGKIATVIGIGLSAPFNARALMIFFTNPDSYTTPFLTALAVANAIGMVWFILPSKISIKGGKFEIVVED